MNSAAHIPDRFRRVVALHVIKHLMMADNGARPLLLGIHGPPGEGKTYQCERVLEEMGAVAFRISGGQLESHAAGEPSRLVRNTYIDAGRSLDKGEAEAAVVLINDVDTGLGNWGEMVQYTINRQTVYGELMHIADYPNLVEGRKTRTIPIIVTGNDFRKLYGPLVRAGRMTSFEWKPTEEEKLPVIQVIFPEIPAEQCRALVQELNAEAKRRDSGSEQPLPVSFFSHLRTRLWDDLLWNKVADIGLRRSVTLIAGGKEPNIHGSISYDELLVAGHALIESGQLIGHLHGG